MPKCWIICCILLGVLVTVILITSRTYKRTRYRPDCSVLRKELALLHACIRNSVQQPNTSLVQQPNTSTYIPRVIHQMWLDKSDDDNLTAPLKYQNHQRSLKIANATFEFEFWNMTRVQELLKHPTLAPFEDLFNNVSPWICKCDVARLLVFAHPETRGGFYIDLDFYGNQSLIPLCDNRELLFVWEPKEHLDHYDSVPGRIFNGFMGTRPGHPIWLKILHHLKDNFSPYQTVIGNTGPLMLGNFAFESGLYKEIRHFIPHCQVMPYAWDHHNQTVFAKECSAKDMETCFVYTLWQEGSGWQYGHV